MLKQIQLFGVLNFSLSHFQGAQAYYADCVSYV